MIKFIYILFSGILMGFSDAVPGISGSTITYILGVYEDFIFSLSNLFKKENFISSFKFLFNLGIGWIIGVITTILLISNAINNNIYLVTSLFLGFVIISIPITFYESFNSFKIDKSKIKYFILGLILVLFIFNLGNLNIFSYVLNSKIILLIYVFIVAMFAVSSMLLPGISGSTVLLIFGLYYPLIINLNKILSGDFSSIIFIFVFILGGLFGLFSVAKIINKAFKNHKANTIYFIEGMLLGSILPIVYAPTSLDVNRLSLSTFSLMFFLLGIIILLALLKIKKIKRGHDER